MGQYLRSLVLAFDTAMAACSVAVAGTGGVLARRYEARARGHAEVLNGMIGEAMEEAGIGFDALARIAVTVGPGTFTGVRIGVAAARGMALALGVPCLGITTLQALALGAAARLDGNANVAVISDARRGELYAQCFTHAAVRLSEPAILQPDAAAALCERHDCTIVGTGAEILAALPVGAGLRFDRQVPGQPDALHVAGWAAGAPLPEGPPEPLYLRAPDARPPASA